MNPKSDDLKGRAKEALGDLTDNDELKREGQADRAGSKAKDVIDQAGEKAKDLVDGVPSMLKQGMKKAEADAFKKEIETAGGKVNLK